MWMNEHDVEQALIQFRKHPVLGPACSTLASLVHGVNRCSDGWPYWKAPGRAAAKLETLIRPSVNETGISYWDTDRPDATPEKLRAAYAQLRRFRTRYPQCEFRIYGTVPGAGVPGDPEPEAPAAPEQHTIRITVTGDRAVVEVTGGGPLPPGRYLGAVVKLTDHRAEAKAS